MLAAVRRVCREQDGILPSIGPVDELLDEHRELDRKLSRRLREQVAGSRLRSGVGPVTELSVENERVALRLAVQSFLFDEVQVVGLRKGHQVSVDLFTPRLPFNSTFTRCTAPSSGR
jgi:hypothetical protein